MSFLTQMGAKFGAAIKTEGDSLASQKSSLEAECTKAWAEWNADMDSKEKEVLGELDDSKALRLAEISAASVAGIAKIEEIVSGAADGDYIVKIMTDLIAADGEWVAAITSHKNTLKNALEAHDTAMGDYSKFLEGYDGEAV